MFIWNDFVPMSCDNFLISEVNINIVKHVKCTDFMYKSMKFYIFVYWYNHHPNRASWTFLFKKSTLELPHLKLPVIFIDTHSFLYYLWPLIRLLLRVATFIKTCLFGHFLLDGELLKGRAIHLCTLASSTLMGQIHGKWQWMWTHDF